MRDLGCIQSPQNAFILNLGLESLHVRMPRHVENGQAVAEFLENHPKVEYVIYPGLKSSKYYETAKKYMPNGGCGVVSFEIKGGREAAEKFEDNHQAWLDRMEIDHYVDCYEVPVNPDYGDDGNVLVQKKGETIITSPLLHVSLKWVYVALPDEVVKKEDFTWVIVRAANRSDAEQKAIKLFDEYNQNT